MKITKLGHCCLVIKIEKAGKTFTILTDPGTFTTGQNQVVEVDLVLITHEHQDHLHVDSLKRVLKNNPQAKVITNSSVGKILDKEAIPYQVVAHGQTTTINDVLIEGFGEEHAEIYKTLPVVENTGYFIENAFFYPGDGFYNPQKPMDILALPVTAPWMKLSDAIDYAIALKPKKIFPVHDGGLNEFGGFIDRLAGKLLGDNGMQYIALELNKETEL